MSRPIRRVDLDMNLCDNHKWDPVPITELGTSNYCMLCINEELRRKLEEVTGELISLRKSK